MKCPYCNLGVKLDVKEQFAYPDKDFSMTNSGKEFLHGICPECNNFVVILRYGNFRWVDETGELNEVRKETIIYPLGSLRSIDIEVPEIYRNIFNEANAVLPISPKASAALSRRLLQQILQDEYHIDQKGENLSKQIKRFIDLPNIPAEIAREVDAIRIIGNFAAHPMKDQNTGVIVDVEDGEADWLLDVLEGIFDFTFIRPKRTQQKKDELNQKLSSMGINTRI